MKLRVAAIQFAPAFGQKMANLRKLATLVKQAAEGGAKLIVLPELATTGYSFLSRQQAEGLAEPLSDEGFTYQTMKALASSLKVHIAWGQVEKDVSANKLYNSQALITPDGLCEKVAKLNLWGSDWTWADEGRSNPPVVKCTFQVGEESIVKKVGLLICRDVRDKLDDKWKSFYEKGDADLVAFSSNWGDGGFPAVAWMEFVRSNDVTLVVANRHGKEIPNDFGEGGICVIKPEGDERHPNGVYCDGLVWDQDCIVFCDV